MPAAGTPPAAPPRPPTTKCRLSRPHQLALRDYVLADTGAQNQADSTVRLLISHSNLQAKFLDIRLDLHVGAGMRATACAVLARPAQMLCNLQSCTRTRWHQDAAALLHLTFHHLAHVYHCLPPVAPCR